MRRHPLDTLSLIAGLVLVAAGVAGFLGPLRLPAIPADVILPVAALAVGIGILLTLRPRGEAHPDLGPDTSDQS